MSPSSPLRAASPQREESASSEPGSQAFNSRSNGDGDAGPPVERAPAPWTTKSECYWLFLTLRHLPKGVYDPLEEPCLEQGEFKGGLGCIMVVRYRETPVGPYDELILIPGNFTVPQPSDGPPKIPKKALRICRIYVSQRTTTHNGRINWNIPKHLARFSFSAPPTAAGSPPPETLTIEVFPPGSTDGDGVRPFFACTLKPFKWIPSIPVSTRWLPVSTAQAQPPIPAAAGFHQAAAAEKEGSKIDPYDISPSHEKALLAGTDRWCSFPIVANVPRARGCWVTLAKGTTEERSDGQQTGKFWPQELHPWSIGAWMEDAEMSIPQPLEWKL